MLEIIVFCELSYVYISRSLTYLVLLFGKEHSHVAILSNDWIICYTYALSHLSLNHFDFVEHRHVW